MTDNEKADLRSEARLLVAEIGVRRARLQEVAKLLAETSAYKDTTIDQMSAKTWQRMTTEERVDWTNYWKMRGASFHCCKCGFPAATFTTGCRVCTPA